MLPANTPESILKLLSALEGRGFAAYIVGGCVRDWLLGKSPNDWDVCTSAMPEEIMELFPHSRPTGLKHGTVTVIIDRIGVEVTTLRREGSYSDHRHPDRVSFVRDIETDLSRRDFTVNAMAISADGTLHDPFGGQEDLQRRLIRCVGEAERRFDEDALRMLRAFRFSAKLGFEIEAATLAAIKSCAGLTSSLAAERVREELEKIISGERPETVAELISIGLIKPWLDCTADIRSDSFLPLNTLPRSCEIRWLGLCRGLELSGITQAEGFVAALKSDRHTISLCTDALAILRHGLPDSELERKTLLHRYGVEVCLAAAVCSDAFSGGGDHRLMQATVSSGECFSIEALAVGGRELMELGYRGRDVGEMLERLLLHVMERPLDNTRETLLKLAAREDR